MSEELVIAVISLANAFAVLLAGIVAYRCVVRSECVRPIEEEDSLPNII